MLYGLVKYADDTQIYMHLKSDETNVNSLEYCFNSVRQWFLLNGLQLNPDKSEAIQLGTAAKLRPGYRVSDIFTWRSPTNSLLFCTKYRRPN